MILYLSMLPDTLNGSRQELKPLEGVLVIAFTNDRPETKLEARTDASGRVRLELPHSGIWLIKAVHMIRAPPSTTEADWESFWASLTFFMAADQGTGVTSTR